MRFTPIGSLTRFSRPCFLCKADLKGTYAFYDHDHTTTNKAGSEVNPAVCVKCAGGSEVQSPHPSPENAATGHTAPCNCASELADLRQELQELKKMLGLDGFILLFEDNRAPFALKPLVIKPAIIKEKS